MQTFFDRYGEDIARMMSDDRRRAGKSAGGRTVAFGSVRGIHVAGASPLCGVSGQCRDERHGRRTHETRAGRYQQAFQMEKGEVRPSFIDTGMFQASMRAG